VTGYYKQKGRKESLFKLPKSPRRKSKRTPIMPRNSKNTVGNTKFRLNITVIRETNNQRDHYHKNI